MRQLNNTSCQRTESNCKWGQSWRVVGPAAGLPLGSIISASLPGFQVKGLHEAGAGWKHSPWNKTGSCFVFVASSEKAGREKPVLKRTARHHIHDQEGLSVGRCGCSGWWESSLSKSVLSAGSQDFPGPKVHVGESGTCFGTRDSAIGARIGGQNLTAHLPTPPRGPESLPGVYGQSC